MEYMLKADDLVGVSFWIISVSMVAATAFFFLEGNSVAKHWQTSVRVAGLVTLIAAIHYYYMRAVWVQTGENPNVFRYIDWLLTVPLQMVEFYLILAAVGAATAGMFWRLLIGTLVMLIAGFLGENGSINVTVGFIVGMAGWIYILYEVFAGEAAQANASSNSKAQQSAYNAMKWIVSIGWSIYPIGYFLGYLAGGTDENSLNAIYNLADIVNKIAFGLVIWAAAKSESAKA
ncbi:MAG: biphenyl 2,3-dioxygenase [Pelagibacteraceae bacterium TMED65]|nr:biphenyl 2,3-dioxygenase [Rickettsiales bacterium]OUU52155.1 MAG: biphenyl 2,3-dioxygenase [Pelagibacteraceae bacterium TMED65]|tara:strand:+ start:1731 stop:2426 length:696 start_codon:yes stop_codon:yes gene_type:complete